MITIILWIVFCVVTYLHPDAWSVPFAAASTVGLTFITACIDGLLVTRWRRKLRAADATEENAYPNGVRDVQFGRSLGDTGIRKFRANYIPGADNFDLYVRSLSGRPDDDIDSVVSEFTEAEARILHNALRKYLGIKDAAELLPEGALIPLADPTISKLEPDAYYLLYTRLGNWCTLTGRSAAEYNRSGTRFTAVYELPEQ